MVDRVAVLGAGTMGSQIAGLLADRGIPCDLLDLRTDDDPDRLAQVAIDRLKTLRPAPVSDPGVLELITPGNFDDHLDRLSGVDLVIEAVSEDLEIKRAIWSRAAQHVSPSAVISTNTSGIPVSSIAEALPESLRPRFLGAHFCNPPRYLPLLELISTPDTDPDVASTVYDISANVLERGVVPAHDVPNFIANTIGVYALMAIVHATHEFGWGFDEVDAITGPAMGRPVSATFRTLDVVGIDVFTAVADNSNAAAAGNPDERRILAVPGYMREMVARGWTGQKAGQGFYRRVETDVGREILVIDPGTLEYGPRSGRKAPASDAAIPRTIPTKPAGRSRDLGQRHRAVRVAHPVANDGLLCGQAGRRSRRHHLHRPGDALGLRMGAGPVRDLGRNRTCGLPAPHGGGRAGRPRVGEGSCRIGRLVLQGRAGGQAADGHVRRLRSYPPAHDSRIALRTSSGPSAASNGLGTPGI